jgi:hypothetical protein
MVLPAEDRLGSELAEALDRPMAPRILTQGQMRSHIVVIDGIGGKDPAQVGLAEDDDVIKAFPGASSRSVSPRARSAKVTSGRSGDRVYPSPQDAS